MIILGCCRVQLTILHHTENFQCPVKLDAQGNPRRQVKRSKATKQTPAIQHVRADPTYSELSFIQHLIIAVMFGCVWVL